MARKHNTQHGRSLSHYPERLRARGETRTPVMRWTGQTTEAIGKAFSSAYEQARTQALKKGEPLP